VGGVIEVVVAGCVDGAAVRDGRLGGVGGVFGAMIHGVEPVGVDRISLLAATAQKEQRA